jgi:anti-sigma B factor antagonist
MPTDDELAAQLEVERLAAGDGIRVLALTGELDMTTTGGFESAVQEALDDGASAVVADLTHVTFIDSSGLAALLGALRSLSLAGARLVIACSNPTVLRLFEVTRADTTFEILATRDDAVTAARRPPNGEAP